MVQNKYKVLMHNQGYQSVIEYLTKVISGDLTPGGFLEEALAQQKNPDLDVETFLEILVNTKSPQIFAESAVYGDGSDWNSAELKILGDVAIAVPVVVYDDGKHFSPKVHAKPFAATLLYVPGALLKNGRGNTPVDLEQVTTNGCLDREKFSMLYTRRLLPSLIYAQEQARQRGKRAFITMPGLGCGCFAGQFRGLLGNLLKRSIMELLSENVERLANVAAVYFDPYNECDNERLEFGHLSFLVRPLTRGNEGAPQLCRPARYEDVSGEFDNCELFSVVAWDHVSWPGNDFYAGCRSTDDGVKAAATSSMAVMTGVEGKYNPSSFMYKPQPEFRTWGELVSRNNLKIQVKDNLVVYPSKLSPPI